MPHSHTLKSIIVCVKMQVSGLTYRLARDASELRSSFNNGRNQRGSHMTDLGSVHERAASIFTLQLSQFAPAAVPGEEDRVLVSVFCVCVCVCNVLCERERESVSQCSCLSLRLLLCLGRRIECW